MPAVTAHLPFPSECGDCRRLTGKLAVACASVVILKTLTESKEEIEELSYSAV